MEDKKVTLETKQLTLGMNEAQLYGMSLYITMSS